MPLSKKNYSRKVPLYNFKAEEIDCEQPKKLETDVTEATVLKCLPVTSITIFDNKLASELMKLLRDKNPDNFLTIFIENKLNLIC